MDTIPKRGIASVPYRFILLKLEKYIPLPVKNPDFYTVLSVLFSIPFLFLHSTPVRLGLLLVVLFLDWMDGAAARKTRGVTHAGYIIDSVYDRLSEGLIVASVLGTWYGNVLFVLYLVNDLLMFYSIKTKKHYLLAVRFFYVLILTVQLFYP